ncbi:ESCRT-II subunit protein VPS25 PWA37_003628 [Arxiozyma heterogenica]|uniref:Uncharacterized protein n=1 Tax=Arxiozyma heterogenica TaxID=278026 RepID=A0AAN7W565_9SACH|nr:hypothetical protein RI543_001023 [Kazachstania heterogenica]
MSSSQLDLPPIYQFPPLFTRQPNKTIRNKQIETWINIILTNCERCKIWVMSKNGDMKLINKDTELIETINIFQNSKINRSCSQIFVNEILLTMKRQNQILNKDGKPPTILNTNTTVENDDTVYDDDFFIMWKSLDQWANEILYWFERTTQLNKVVTFYEIVSNEENSEESFYSMPESLLYQVLKILVKRGRATMLKDDSKYVAIKVV